MYTVLPATEGQKSVGTTGGVLGDGLIRAQESQEVLRSSEMRNNEQAPQSRR